MTSFHWSRPISFSEVDWARILYYPRYFDLCHQAFEAYMAEVTGMSYAEFLAREELGFPTVHLEADYIRPFPYGSTMHIEVALVRLGTKSMDVEYRGRVERDGELHARARVTNVLVGMNDFGPRPMPTWLRERLEARLEA